MKRILKSLGLSLLTLVSGLVLSGCSDIISKTKPAGLQVLTNDVPATLYLDNEYLGDTPFIDKSLDPGTYTLKIEPESSELVSYETLITLRKGLLTVVTWKPGTRPELSGGVVYELERLTDKSATELSIVSIPDGAIVSVDSGEKNFTPFITQDLDEGSHSVSFSLPSYESQEHTINMVAGHRLNVSVKLAKSSLDTVSTTVPIATESATLTATAGASLTATGSATVPSATTLASTNSGTLAQTATLGQTVGRPRVVINATNYFQNGVEVLRVRDAAGTAGAELGFAEVGSAYSYLNLTTSGWHKINFNGAEGWVSTQYSTLEQ